MLCDSSPLVYLTAPSFRSMPVHEKPRTPALLRIPGERCLAVCRTARGRNCRRRVGKKSGMLPRSCYHFATSPPRPSGIHGHLLLSRIPGSAVAHPTSSASPPSRRTLAATWLGAVRTGGTAPAISLMPLTRVDTKPNHHRLVPTGFEVTLLDGHFSPSPRGQSSLTSKVPSCRPSERRDPAV
jgi:hypothetical protein